MTDADNPTQSEIVEVLGEEIGQMLIDGGYTSLTNLINATDEELLEVEGMNPDLIEEINFKLDAQFESEEVDEDGLEEETAGESEVETPPGAEGPKLDDEAETSSEDQPPDPVLQAPEVENQPAMSVRLRRIKEAEAKAEAERKREQSLIEANRIDSSDSPDVLGSVPPDFVPIEDRIPSEADDADESELGESEVEDAEEVEEAEVGELGVEEAEEIVEANEVDTEEIGPDG